MAALSQPISGVRQQLTYSTSSVVARVARAYLVKRWRAVAAAFVLAATTAGLSALMVDLLQPALNSLVASKTRDFFTFPLILASLAIARGGSQAMQAMLVNHTGAGVVGDIQVELHSTLVRADLAHLRKKHSGEFVSQALYDTGLISDAASAAGVNLLQQALQLCGAIVVMIVKDWRLAVFVLLAGPVLATSLQTFTRRSIHAARGAMQATGVLSTAIIEGLAGVRVVKMEGREADEVRKVATFVERRQEHILGGANARALAAPVSESLTMVVATVILAYEGWKATRGHSDIGGFVAFFGALLLGGQALRQVANLSAVLAQGVAAAHRLFATLDVQPEIRDVDGVSVLGVDYRLIDFDNVSFAYNDAEPILRNVSLTARRGETIAIVGPSGSGKTTLLGLLPRFYDVYKGAITIDGQDIRNIRLSDLRNNIALVTQEPFLFDDTIAANISYSKSNAVLRDIEDAAKEAAAHEFILAFPNGYETKVGEGGLRLSGGQRQRIVIARAFLKNAPILLLDEATSALDTESESQVRLALRRLMAGRTTLVIAHRLSTVQDADRIYVLDGGRVVEQGTHEMLLTVGGLYSRLAETQDLSSLLDSVR